VEILSEQDRLKRLQEVLTAWQSLLKQPPRSGAISDEQREQWLIDAMIKLAGPEIRAAYVEDPAACVYCDLFSMDDAATMKERVLAVIPKGMKRAGRTYTEKYAKVVGEHVKSCIATELANLKERLRAQAQKKEPEAFLSAVLDWPRSNAAVLLEEMTFKQRSGVLELLFTRTDTKVVCLGDEPEDEVLWRLWYVGLLQATDTVVRDLLEEENRPVIVLLGEAWGTPLSPEK
jgi:hypothetical protein